jgi:hypothetical protein
VEVHAAVGFADNQLNAIRQLQHEMPGKFFGPLADWLRLSASTYRAHDIAKLISASYFRDLRQVLVADQATQDLATARIPGSQDLEFWRLDHISEEGPRPYTMPHQ